MPYLLLIPLVTFAALVVLTRETHAHSTAGCLQALMLLGLAVATAGDLMLGSTPDPAIAAIGAAISLTGAAVASLLLPVVPIAFAYGRLTRSGANLLRGLAAIAILLLAAVPFLMARSTHPLLVPAASGGYQFTAPNAHPAVMVDHLIAIGSRLLTGGILLFLMLRNHIAGVKTTSVTVVTLWTLVVLGLLAPGLSRWVSAFLLAGMFTLILATFRHARPLRGTLSRLYASHAAGLVVLDDRGRVAWLNSTASQMLGVTADGPRPDPALLFADTPYASVWHWAKNLPAAQAIRRFQIEDTNSTQTLYAYVEPLPRQADLAGWRAIRLAKVIPPDLSATPILGDANVDPSGNVVETLSNGSDIQATLAQAIQTALEVTGLDTALVYLREPDDPDALRLASAHSVRNTALEAPEVIRSHEGFVGTAVVQGRPVLLDKSSRRPDATEATDVAGLSVGVATPLTARGQVLGALAFLGQAPHDITPSDVLLLESVGDQLGTAYDSAHLYAAEYRQRVQAEILNQIVSAIGKAASFDDTLEAVLEQLRRVVDYDSAGVALFSEEQSDVRIWWRLGHANKSTESIPLSEVPVFQHLCEHKQALRIADTHQHPLWRTDILAGPGPRSSINAPLLIRDECIGALSIDSNQVDYYSEEDEQVVQNLANHLAIAVENAHLLGEAQQRNEMLTALNRMAAATSASLQLDELLATALEMVGELTGMEMGGIHLISEDETSLQLQAKRNMPETVAERVRTIGYGEGFAGHVWQTGEPLVTDNYREDPRRLANGVEYRMFVCVPLVAKGKVIGVLAVGDRRQLSLSEKDLEFIVSMGRQLGVAIENARLYQTVLTRARTAAQLSFLGVRLTASLDMAETLELICQHALDIFETDGAYIWLKEGDKLVGAAALGRGREQFVGTRVDIDDPLAVGARVVRDKKPQVVSQAELAALNQDLVRQTACKSVMGFPLFQEEQAMGAMMLVSTDDPNHFSQSDFETANLLSTHAALAIDSARLFEKTSQQVRQLQLVQEVGRDVSSHLDLDLLLAAVARRLWSAFGYYAVIIVVRDGDKLTPRVLMRHGHSLKIGTDAPSLIEEHGLIGTAARQGRTLLTPDVSKEPLFVCTPVLPDTRAELTIPLMLAGEVLGVLDVQSDRPGSLTQADVELLQPLAAQIAISLSNAQLFQALRDYTAELETRVNERTQRIREQQERITAILRSVGDGVAVVNLAGQIILTNPQADALLRGQGRSPALGQRIREAIHDLAAQPESNAERQLDLAGLSIEAHATKLVEAGNVQGTVVVLHDITHLQEIDRLKSEFVTTVSHELRTPMANLKLYLKLLQEGKPEHQSRYVDTMQRETARLEHLIGNLLDLSRLDDPSIVDQPRKPVDLNELVRRVVTNHEPQAETEKISLQASLDETLPPVFGNRNQLIQVLTNLISNALAYTPEGGDVWIRSATQSALEESEVVITVEDSGVGISPDELELIFDRFYRGRNADILNVPGSGLGLAIVKDIVELHGGSIAVSSAVGVGSTFSLTFPVQAGVEDGPS